MNITRGFEKTRIWPYNRDIFTDDEFLTSYVTDRNQGVLPNSPDAPPEPSDSAEIIETNVPTATDVLFDCYVSADPYVPSDVPIIFDIPLDLNSSTSQAPTSANEMLDSFQSGALPNTRSP